MCCEILTSVLLWYRRKKKKQKDAIEKAADTAKADETVKVSKTPAEKAFEKVQEKRVRYHVQIVTTKIGYLLKHLLNCV